MKKAWFSNSRISAYVGAAICTALWGTAFPLIKLGYEKLNIQSTPSRLLFAGERFTLAGIMVFVFALLLKRKPILPDRRSLLPIAGLGVVQTFLQYLFAYIGVALTTAANTSILTGTVSIISVALAAVFFKSDRLTPLKTAGCALGLFGIVFVNLKDFSFGAAFFGDLIVLLSAFCGALGNIITKKVSPDRDPAALTAFQLFVGGVILLAVGLLTGGTTDFSRQGSLVILLWLSLVSSVSFLLWTALLKKHPVSRITVFTMLVPIFGTVWSAVFLGENAFKIENLISLLLITAGIVLVNIRGEKWKSKA